MYWPSVQDDSTSVSPLARGVIYAAPRLFGRSTLLEMKDLRFDTPSGSMMQPLCALLQPITDTLSRRLQTTTAAINQSTLASVVRRSVGVEGKHENSSCTR